MISFSLFGTPYRAFWRDKKHWITKWSPFYGVSPVKFPAAVPLWERLYFGRIEIRRYPRV